MFPVKQFVLVGCVALYLSACAVGPDFTPPPSPVTKSYTESNLPKKTVESKGPGGEAQHFLMDRDIPGEWWQLFQSPALNDLIIKALKNSPNLQAAEAALRQAEANLRVSASSLFPFLSAQYYEQRQQSSGAGFGPINTFDPTRYNLYYATVNVTYNLDVFGGTRRLVEASQAQLNSQKFQVEAALLTLTSNIVTTAITEASLRAQILATHELIFLQEKELCITEKKFKIGVVSQLDLLAQKTQLSETKASLAPLEKTLSQTRHALAVLIGEPPSTCKLPTFSLDDLYLPSELPISLPSALVCQRPDVKAAEELLHAACAQIGVSVANFFPQLTLSGNFGWYAGAIKGFFDKDNLIWNIMANVLQPIFQGGALTGKRDASIAGFEQAFAQYRQTVLQAFQNVADTLKALEFDAQQLYHQTEAEAAARKTFELIQRQYAMGAVSYLNLLDAERQYLQTRIARIQAQASRYADTVALYQALGGGWWNRKLPCTANQNKVTSGSEN
jgi:NodT family efflux transporter outer membrane factor (OMF) lipoprotein